ncbi:MAG: hypothetical protein IKN83_08130 [Bacteroidaceae bacterium]|nr:hypothetical protein [Bacteroidaceae bacterium]MBR3531320.1 hypothetical protein [Bacteroidaceae bacterium]
MKKFFTIIVLLSLKALSSNAQTQLVGDANNDGSLDISDIVTIVNNVLSDDGLLSFNVECDANSDGIVDISDIVLVVNRVLGGINAYKTCPDDHHPHIIDLGLPSGTLWACCNVGANKPKEYGNKYAWGETEEKDVFNFRTYKHAYYTDNQNSGPCDFWESQYVCWYYKYIGENICGTEYDVAHAKWGTNWQMPTYKQAEEIINYWRRYDEFGDEESCGVRFYFDNGGMLVLPEIAYWTGTLNHYQPQYAWQFYSYREHTRLNGYGQRGRIEGFPIRPVWIP